MNSTSQQQARAPQSQERGALVLKRALAIMAAGARGWSHVLSLAEKEISQQEATQ